MRVSLRGRDRDRGWWLEKISPAAYNPRPLKLTRMGEGRICRLRGLRRARVIKRCCPSQHACRDVGLAESGFALVPLPNRKFIPQFAFRNPHFSASLSGLHSSLIDKFERFRADTDLSSKWIIHSA